MATALEQLRYIDEQLEKAALPPDQAELVRVHRLTGLQLRSQRMSELGSAPPLGTEQHAEWEKCKKEVDSEIDLSLSETRLSVEGLEEAWDQWLHVEKLKKVREQLLQQTAAEGTMPEGEQLTQGNGQQHLDGHTQSIMPGQLHDAASWESLQIAPLTSPGAWEAQQQQTQQMQQHIHAQMQEHHDPGQEAVMHQGVQMDMQHGGQEMHLQEQWQQLAQQQDVQGQQMEQPEQSLQQQTAPNPEGVPMKLCRRCNTHKPVTQFYKSKANADGYDGRCKACDAVQCAQRRKRKERIENPTVEWKVCRRCGTNKPAADFYRNKTNSDGLYNNCKSCFSQDAQHRRERLPPLEERTASAKECRRCKETKPASEFYKNKHMSDGLYTHCKQCYTEAANQRSAGRAPAETKRCRRCGNTKESAEFYVSKMTADGLQSYCKACYAVASAARRSRNSHESGSGMPKEILHPAEYAQQQVLQEHLMQGQLVDPMQQQQGLDMQQMQPGMDAAAMQQMVYHDPSGMQAALGDHQGHPHAGMEHPHAGMEHQHTGLEHHHSGLEHHSMEHQHPDMDHHHLEHAGHADGEYQPGLDHSGLDHHQQHVMHQHDHHLHEHQPHEHQYQADELQHQHEHAVM